MLPRMSDSQVNSLAQALSAMQDSPVSTALDSMVAELRTLLQKRRDERNAIVARQEQELAPLDVDIARLEGAIVAIKGRPQSRRPAKKRVGTTSTLGTPTGFGITVEVAQEAADYILAHYGDGTATFTQRDLYKALGWDQTRMSNTMKFFRHIEFVRKAGQAGTRGTSTLWALMDRDALTKFKERKTHAPA
jgi:hypothetical protein